MNASTPFSSELVSSASGGGDVLQAQQLQMLTRLAEIGMEIAEAIGRQATSPDAQTTPVFQGDLAMAFSRVSRGVRMTLALQARLADEREKAARKPVSIVAATERKERIERIVSRVVDDAHEDDHETAEYLTGEASERLSDGDIYGDVMRRPVSEIIDEICRDLGIEPDWACLAQEGWAREEIEDGPVGAPLAAFGPLPSPPPPSSPSHLLRG